MVQVELHDCRSLVCIIIPSSVRAIGNGAFARCDLLRNVTISPTSAITRDEFANSFPTLHIKEITLDLMKGRFDELSLNGLCNNYNPMQGDQGDAFIHMVNLYPVKNFQDQDCFGMTPLHVLLCSGRDCYDTLSSTCRRRVADMSPTSPNVAKSWPTMRVVATQKRPRHTQFMSITADKYKSVQTYELATLP